ncbi:MAG: fimbrillin family protein [Bacteroides sp.]|nr:fimbrillin family protein [Bacteroides sp.]
MKKKFFWMALAATAMASCSQDEVVEMQQNEIKFNVATEKMTRAAEIYDAVTPMSSFKVWADLTRTKAGQTTPTTEVYIDGDVITNKISEDATALTSIWNGDVVRYWPSASNGTLDFYALVNEDSYDHSTKQVTFTAGEAEVDANGRTITTLKNKDLLYAVAVDQTKESNTLNPGSVRLNFRHALSQILFQAKNENPQLYIEIGGVKIGQVKNKGVLTLEELSTSSQWDVRGGVGDPSNTVWNHSKWAWADDAKTLSYYISVAPSSNRGVPVKGNGQIVGLTTTNASMGTQPALLIPTEAETGGKTTAWIPTANASSYNGTYLAVLCTFYNVSTPATEDNPYPDPKKVEIDPDMAADINPAIDEAVLYSGFVYIPVSFEWEQGKKYVYTFTFGKGTDGGYEGGAEDVPDPEPTPALVPITYEVSIDDFVAAEGEEEVNTEDTSANS